MDLTVAYDGIPPAPGDAMGVLLILESPRQQVVDAAVLDGDVVAEDGDAIAGRIPDLAVAEGDVRRGDFHPVATFPPAIDQEIFVDTGFRDQ